MFSTGKEKILSRLKFRESGILLALILLCVILSFATPSFLTSYNISVVFRQISYVAIVALGQTLVLLTGGIDLSLGSNAGLSAILGSILMARVGIDPYMSMFLAVLIGMGCGIINGILISKVRLNPFIVTLAMGEVLSGLVLVITKGYTVMGIPPSFQFLGQGMIGRVPVPVILTLILAIILVYILRNTPFGRHVYAVGGNESAARLVGIRVDRVKIAVYAIAGALAAFAGMVYVSRMNAGQVTIGQSWLMPSVTAAIIGGTSLSGGEGTIPGTLIGATLMGILANGIVLLNVSSYWEKVIIGTVVVIAVVIDVWRSLKQNKK